MDWLTLFYVDTHLKKKKDPIDWLAFFFKWTNCILKLFYRCRKNHDEFNKLINKYSALTDVVSRQSIKILSYDWFAGERYSFPVLLPFQTLLGRNYALLFLLQHLCLKKFSLLLSIYSTAFFYPRICQLRNICFASLLFFFKTLLWVTPSVFLSFFVVTDSNLDCIFFFKFLLLGLFRPFFVFGLFG